MSYKIEFRIGVATPVDDIYDLIADIDAWPQWSPIHQAATGRLSFGAPIHLEEKFEGLGMWEIDGVLSDWAPYSHLHVFVPKPFYAGKLMRYFEFEALSEIGSAFTVGALFEGFLSEREGRAYGKYVRRGFEAFAEAAKAKAETNYNNSP
ncbi:MAG: SRPBCC family protein, partial [Asticcacaulis sp.]|nr:SRPBCC family protein [Asticcacaulis sp.]